MKEMNMLDNACVALGGVGVIVNVASIGEVPVSWIVVSLIIHAYAICVGVSY